MRTASFKALQSSGTLRSLSSSTWLLLLLGAGHAAQAVIGCILSAITAVRRGGTLARF